MFHRVLASWAQDALALRQRGWDVPGAAPAACTRPGARLRGPVRPPSGVCPGASQQA